MHVEPEFEAWMARLMPGCQHQWVGASPGEIDALEKHVGRPLPAFYRWFLAKMGRSNGPFDVAKLDMSIGAILSLYEQGYVPDDPNLLAIGVHHETTVPFRMFLDLSRQARNDAWVCRGAPEGIVWLCEAETLREWLAHIGFIKFRLRGCAHEVAGTVRYDGDILATIEPVLASLQFSKVIPTGHCCGIYDRPDVGLELSVAPSPERTPFLLFQMAGDDKAVLRRILRTIAAKTPVDVEVREWGRPLPR